MLGTPGTRKVVIGLIRRNKETAQQVMEPGCLCMLVGEVRRVGSIREGDGRHRGVALGDATRPSCELIPGGRFVDEGGGDLAELGHTGELLVDADAIAKEFLHVVLHHTNRKASVGRDGVVYLMFATKIQADFSDFP